MKQNKYFWTSIGLYMNYFVQGIQAIIIAQNIALFAEKWGTNNAGVMGVIAATGIGKVLILLFSGILSDKFGRKPLIYIGMVGYIAFFGGLMFNTSLTLAYVIAFTAGAATSFLDGSTYPALMEIYPDNPSSASVVVKGFISTSGMLLPIFIGWLNGNNIWYGWSLVIPMIIVIINSICLLKAKFPDQELRELKASGAKVEEKEVKKVATKLVIKEKPKYAVEGIILMLYAFCCMSTFYLFQQVATLYGVEVLGMTEISARALLTYYTAGSFIAVLLSSIIMSKGIRDMAILVIYGAVSSLSLVIMYLFPSQVTMTIGAFAIGFTVAGGVLQTGNAMLSQFFPEGKGRNTSAYNVFMSLATYVMPTVASYLMKTDFTKVMLLDTGVAICGFVLMIILSFRYKKVFGVKNIFSKTN